MERSICPICKVESRRLDKWVKNKYGRKYYYSIFLHPNENHYVRKDITRNRNSKNLIKNKVLNLLLTGQVPEKLISINGMKNLLEQQNIRTSYETLRYSLLALSKEGILGVDKVFSNLYFINKVSEIRNRIVYEEIDITLGQVPNSKELSEIQFNQLLYNPTNYKLYYISLIIFGDVPRKFKDINFKVSINSEYEPQVFVIEDRDTYKRIVLKLKKPIEPHSNANLSIFYIWPIIDPPFIIDFPSTTKNITVNINTIDELKVEAFIINPATSEKSSLSPILIKAKNYNELYNYHYKIQFENNHTDYTFDLRWKFI